MRQKKEILEKKDNLFKPSRTEKINNQVFTEVHSFHYFITTLFLLPINDKSNNLSCFLVLEQPWRMPGHLLDSLECVKVKAKNEEGTFSASCCRRLQRMPHAWPGFAFI